MSGAIAVTDCRKCHLHTDPRAGRACDLFDRAYARYERRNEAWGGRWQDGRGFRLWMDAGRLVNDLFGIAMSDFPSREFPAAWRRARALP